MEEYFIYIIRCRNNSLYTGVTSNLVRRFQEHKTGRGGRFTKLSKADKFLYYENYPSKKEALKREKQIKGWRREKKLILISSRRRSSTAEQGHHKPKVTGASPVAATVMHGLIV